MESIEDRTRTCWQRRCERLRQVDLKDVTRGDVINRASDRRQVSLARQRGFDDSLAMRALTLVADRKIELTDMAPPAAPQAGEVQIRVKAVGLNHLDLWGFRGMAFAKRKLPLVVGAEAAGEIAAVPMPEPPACTRIVSPASSLALSNNMC